MMTQRGTGGRGAPGWPPAKIVGSLNVRCPKCGARVGRRCTTTRASTCTFRREAHVERRTLWKAMNEPDPCAGGNCPDPQMHAEGGHDI